MDFRGSRDEEAIDFWVVYVIGIYEIGYDIGEGNDLDPIPYDADNDPNIELAEGVAINFESEPEAAIVGYEVVRDVADDEHKVSALDYYAIAIAHEIGHQFELDHSPQPQDLMWSPYDEVTEGLVAQVPWRWSSRDIARIRNTRIP